MAASVVKTNVHEVASPFVGRGTELAAIARCFDEGARLVTLTGPGGVGKTRIASRFAAASVAAYSEHGGGGAWQCSLVDARHAMAIGAVVGATIGVVLKRSTHVDRVLAELGAAIARRKRVLVVLDNFDHLTSEAASTVGVWMQVAPRARFLVTSRSALGLVGEQLWPVTGLAVPEPHAPAEAVLASEAVELFVRRARLVRPTLPLGDGEAAEIAEIVRRVDGLPLAIELAAARTQVLSTAQIRDRLDQPLALLVRSNDAGRHASMRNVVLESVHALDPTTEACFVGCAIFRGGFSLASAEAVLGAPDAEVLPMLEALGRSSLLRTSLVAELGSEPRLHFYETIREVAAERLTGTMRTALALRHATHFAQLGRSLAERGDADAIARLGLELENLVDAHRFAIDTGRSALALALALGLDPLLARRGLFRLRLRLLDEAIAATEEATADLPAALCARGSAHRELGALELARADLKRALALATTPEHAASAQLRLGELAEVAGATDEARAYFARALASIAAAPTSATIRIRSAEAHAHLGHTLRREGALDEAAHELARALELFRGAGQGEGIAAICYELAVVALFRRNYSEARARFDEALAGARELGARQLEAAVTSGLAILLQETGRVDEALALHAQAAQAFRELGNRHREGSALYYLGGASIERGELAQGEAVLAQAASAVAEVGAPRYEALIASLRGAGFALAGQLAEAREAFAQADRAAAACASEPAVEATIEIHRLQLALRDAPPADRAALIAQARASAEVTAGDDPRLALRLIEGRVSATAQTWIVRAQALAFRLPGEDLDVDLSRRQPLRRLLAALARRRVEAPGDALALDDLLAAGWPNEHVAPQAAVNRVHVALTTLRKLGLRDLLVSGERGYLLDPAIPIAVEPG